MAEERGNGRRDLGMLALFEGFFAFAWFGWGQEAPPQPLRVGFAIGAVLAVLVAVAGAVLGLRASAAGSALRERAARRRYGILVGVEFAVAGAGAGVLGALGHSEFIAAWVCAVVAVHFFPLAPVLRDRSLVPLGALMCVVAGAAFAVPAVRDVAASTVTGVGAGGLLLLFGSIALVRAATLR